MGTSFGKVVVFEGRKYRVVSEIARGRFASIVMVKDMQTNREYALKRSVVKNRDTELQRIARHEATLLGTMPSHRYIVKSCGYKQRAQPNDTTEHLLLLEYCTGGNLYEQLERAQRPWALDKILTCFSSIAQAVKHLHSQKPCICHRDIRLENVLIDSKGSFKLCDLGSSTKGIWSFSTLANLEAMENNVARHTSPHWRAPELVNLRKWKRIGLEVDVWALGVMFYHLLFLKPPFGRGRTRRIPTGEFIVPEHPSYPRAVIRLLHQMLEVNPSKRATIDEVLQSIREICLPSHEDESKYAKDVRRPRISSAEKRAASSLFSHPLSRATNSALGPPKAKHVRRLIVLAWQQEDTAKSCEMLFNEIVARTDRCDAVITYKTLQTIHKLMQQGPIEVLREVYRIRQSIVHAVDSSRFPSAPNHYLDKALREILPLYAKYLYQRSELHHYFPMIEGNFSISAFFQSVQEEEESKFDVKKWNIKTLESLNRMFELSFQLKELSNLALVGRFHTGRTHVDSDSVSANEFRESVIIPIIDDVNAIFLTSTYLLGLLRVSMGRQRIQRLLVSYKQQFIKRKQVFEEAKASSRIVQETRRLPPVTETPPKLNRQATVESNIFPHASTIPELSEQTQTLATFFRSKILAMFPLRQRAGGPDTETPTKPLPTSRHNTNLIVFGPDDITKLHEQSRTPSVGSSSSSGDRDSHTELEEVQEQEPTSEQQPEVKQEPHHEGETDKEEPESAPSPTDAFRAFDVIPFDKFTEATEIPRDGQTRGSREEDRAKIRKKKNKSWGGAGSSSPPSDSRQKLKTQKFIRKSKTRKDREIDEHADNTPRRKSSSPSPRYSSPRVPNKSTEQKPVTPAEEKEPHPGSSNAVKRRQNRKNESSNSTSHLEATTPVASDRRMTSPRGRGTSNGRTARVDRSPTPAATTATATSTGGSGGGAGGAVNEGLAPQPEGWDKEWPHVHASNGSTDSWKPFTDKSSPFKEDDLDASELSFSEDDPDDERTPGFSNDEDELEWEDLTIGDRIGIGGFAEVFKGTWCGGEVAIKRLIHQKQTDETLEEFRAEVSIMRKLQHPNITLFMGACTVPPFLTLVTELLEMSLFDLLHNTTIALSWRIKLKIALGTARGLDFLHNFEQPIVHRDLKSANVLLDKHFGPRLADFGLSRIKATNYTMTAQTGTFQWMSPEVVAGKRYTEKADVFSYGIILWELCSRKIPYEGLNGYQVSVAVVNRKIRPKIDARLIPDDWGSLMQACWQEEPGKRPSVSEITRTVEQMQRDYERSHPR